MQQTHNQLRQQQQNQQRQHQHNASSSHTLRNRTTTNNNDRQHKQQHSTSPTGSARARQQRAGRHYARTHAQAGLQSNAAHQQLDTGFQKYQQRLQHTPEAILQYVTKENTRQTRRSQRGKFKLAAAEIWRREQAAAKIVSQETEQVVKEDRYGYFPREKPDDAVRLMYENWNSLGIFTGDKKITTIDGLVKRYQVDILAGCETQCDWRQAERSRRFQHLLAFGQRKKCIVGHNTTERTVRDQKGGTAMATFGRLSASVHSSGSDYTGLGRWCWQLIKKGDKTTRVVVAYQPGEPGRDSKGYTVFEQHQRYFEARGDFRSPRTIFFQQLISQLLLWKAAGEEIILCGDFNENVYDSRLGKRLALPDLLMREQCHLHTGDRLPNTFVTGSRPIDAVYATSGTEVIHAGLLPKYGGVGDHRCFILDFTSQSVLGKVLPRVLPPHARKLNCFCKRIRDNYNSLLDQLCDRHAMYKKMNELTNLADLLSPAEFQIKMNRWDEEMTDYMRASEDKCHKFKQDHTAWSPKYGVWKRRHRLLTRVGKFLQGRIPDSRNLIRDCLKKKIGDPRQMTQELLKVELFICGKEMAALQARAPQLRHEHLQRRLATHRKSGNTKAIDDITRIIRRESQERRYSRLR